MNILKWKGLDVDPKQIVETMTAKMEIAQIDTAFNESTSESDITVLYPKIEAIHEGRTLNFNRYTAEKLKGDPALKSGVYSWTNPYPKPVIHNHDTNTEATGRVYSASYSEFTASGRPGIIVVPKITQKKAIQDAMDGRLLTVSIGASTNAAVCSICGTDIINEGFCGHMRGQEYDGQTTEWIAGDLWFDELSWVNVPADQDAMVTSLGISDSTLLTTEKIVVKSIGESTKKEDEVVELVKEREIKVEDPSVVVEEEEVIADEEEADQAEVNEDEVIADPEVEVVDPEVEDELEDKEEEEVIDADKEDSDEDEDIEGLKAKLIKSEDLVKELKSTNQALAKDFSETITNLLVDLRISVGKESDRDVALERFSTRSTESIKDSLTDLIEEKIAPAEQVVETKARTVEHIEKPIGDTINHTETSNKENKELASTKEQVITNEEIFLKLLKGRK